MSDRLMEHADEIERRMTRQIGELYGGALLPVLDKHKGTLDRLRALADNGEDARVRTLLRTSGIVDEAADALALAGRKASIIIRNGIRDIREEASHEQDDDGASGAH